MIPVLEAVPNFSEGRDAGFLRALVDAVEAHPVEVLDVSSDADHHRSVLTFIGPPDAVEGASEAAARLAMEWIDLRTHRGIHPRTGALDVLPFVPLHDVTLSDAVASAHRVGRRLRALGLPVNFYGAASDPPGVGLATLRRGGFEAMESGFTEGRVPDLPVEGAPERPHPTAGVTNVGARRVLLAWNVFLEGVGETGLHDIAAAIRERGGGFPHLRALGLYMPESGRSQISMNLEAPDVTSPVRVFDEIRRRARETGGEVVETEVVGMIPDALVFPDSVNRLVLSDVPATRFLSKRVAGHVSARASRAHSPTSPQG